MKVLVTGGAGFIGSAVVYRLLADVTAEVVVLDKLTYAGNRASLAAAEADPRCVFVQADICDGAAVAAILARHQPDAVMHLAAESHVDRSIDGPADFIHTNITGTWRMLEAALDYWRRLPDGRRAGFCFHHVSTDEVFGSLGPDAPPFTERTPYDPRSPYSSSKAAADHLVSAWGHTYGLPVVVSNCSNNYGPRQFPEKLIPLMILNALAGRPLPVYGRGDNVRDWLHVEDHAEALVTILARGRQGETYLVGGNAERRNLDVVHTLCRLLDEMVPDSPFRPHESLVTFVADRPGHDHRYAIDASKLRDELGWQPAHTFEDGLRQTVRWYLDNPGWWQPLVRDRYDGTRLGLGHKGAGA